MSFLKARWREIFVASLMFANVFAWLAVYQRQPDNIMHVYFFDIGQGDSALIDSPSHGRVLIDGGPDRKVLSELGRALPFGDKRIDVVIETHPDRDHIGGLPEVMTRFDVGAFMEPGVESDNTIDDTLEARIDDEHVPDLLARKGTVIDFGDGARLEILFPESDVSHYETNDASVIAKLSYRSKSFLFTGDAPFKTENILMSEHALLDVDVLKAGHHGSKTSTSDAFLKATTPEYAIISAGTDNDYGHPTKETLDRLKAIGARILATEDRPEVEGLGTIEFETDGTTLLLK